MSDVSVKIVDENPPTMGEEDETKLHCTICMDDYDTVSRQPQTLDTCGHTFCTSCINRLNSKQCPYDRIPFMTGAEETNNIHRSSQQDEPEPLPPRQSVFHNFLYTLDCLALVNKFLFALVFLNSLPILIALGIAAMHAYTVSKTECPGADQIIKWMLTYSTFIALSTMVSSVIIARVFWSNFDRVSNHVVMTVFTTFFVYYLAFGFLTLKVQQVLNQETYKLCPPPYFFLCYCFFHAICFTVSLVYFIVFFIHLSLIF